MRTTVWLGACVLLAAVSGAWAQSIQKHEVKLQQLLDRGQAEEAARHWGENRSYFWDNAEQHKALLTRLRDAVNPPHEARMKAAAAQLEPFAAASQPVTGWANVIRALSEARAALDAYRALPIAVDDFLRSERYIELEAALAQVTEVYLREAPGAFARYDHASAVPFARAYPVEVPDEVIAQAFDALKPRLRTASAETLGAFAGTYGRALDARQKNELGAMLAEARYRGIVPDGTIDGPRAGQLLSEIAAGRLDGSQLPLRLVYLWSTERASDGDFPVSMQAPHSLNAAQTSRAELESRLAQSDVAIFIDVHRPSLNRSNRGSRAERSVYKSGTRPVPNPAWQQAQQQYMLKQQEYQRLSGQNSQLQSQAQQVMQGGFGSLIGLLGSAVGHGAVIAARNQLSAAEQQMNSTPQTIDEDTMVDYTFNIAEIQVTRRAPVTLYLVDMKNRRYYKQTVDRTERRIFESAEALDQRDPRRDAIVKRYATPDAVRDFSTAPAKLDAPAVAEALRSLGGAAPQPLAGLQQDIDQERQRLAAQ